MAQAEFAVRPPGRRASALVPLALLLALGSCGEGGDEPPPPQPSVRLSPREPGSIALPTSPRSVRLYSIDAALRFVLFKDMLLEAGQPCAAVTGAVLKGGAAGMDVWRVSCSDSGDWAVSIDADSPPTVLRCSSLPGNECDAVWSKP